MILKKVPPPLRHFNPETFTSAARIAPCPAPSSFLKYG
jgi:hypothetical protein